MDRQVQKGEELIGRTFQKADWLAHAGMWSAESFETTEKKVVVITATLNGHI